MTPVQIICAIAVALATVVGVSVFVRACVTIGNRMGVGRSVKSARLRPVGRRTLMTLGAILGHQSFKNRPWIRVAHWLVMVSFPLLFLTLVTGYGQVFNTGFVLPLIGHAAWWEWVVEFIAVLSLVSIVGLMVVRTRLTRGGRSSRFTGSTAAQARFVEWVVLGVVLCVLALRALEYAHLQATGETGLATAAHFPLTAWAGGLLGGLSAAVLADAIAVVATVKILISMSWFVVVGRQPSMGVAWHRFLAIVNVYARREVDSTPALGPLAPIEIDGRPLTEELLEELEDDEDLAFGVGKIEDFTWKGLLDFSTCTECGRCQDLCPAWNTGKPLSPKLMTLALRDHHAAAAPYLRAASALGVEADDVSAEDLAARPTSVLGMRDGLAVDTRSGLVEGTAHTQDILGALLAAKAAPSDTGVATNPAPLVGEVLTADALWACTTCGACVDQCPVDIEHVDHIVDMRRHQVLMESAFPKELGQMFRKLETKGNPWGLPARKRLEWAKDLDFEVPVVGEDVEDASAVEYLFWVGCAGAYEDRAKKTTRAVAELLHTAGVSFAVLGDAEACTGDPARRAGNEILFQMLAAQNVETLNEVGASKIVVTCAHCFNTMAREYPQLGGTYEVVHHTQLLNTLVREGRLTPVAPRDGGQLQVTYHDACYLGRHNQVYNAPRELLAATGAEKIEMPRNQERALCCGGGGARAFMEESIGTRIAVERSREALGTGASVVATACPFCTTMLSDGVASEGGTGDDGEKVRVTDVATLMLEAVRRSQE